MTETVLYVDELTVHALMNGWVDYLLLGATAQLADEPLPRRRRLAGAAVGTAYYVLYRLANVGLLPGGSLWSSLAVLLLFGGLMLTVAFGWGGRQPSRWVGLLGPFGLFACLAAGSAFAIAYRVGTPAAPQWPAGFLTAAFTLLVSARLAWGLTHRAALPRSWQGRLRIDWRGRSLELPAWLDSGNQAEDPLTHDPVIVAEVDAVVPLLPVTVVPAVRQLAAGRWPADSNWMQHPDSCFLRPLPYAAVGQPRGLLWCFRPDKVHWHDGYQEVETRRCLLGLTSSPLDRHRRYRALVPAALAAAAVPTTGPQTVSSPRSWPAGSPPANQSSRGGSLVHGSAIPS
ncbi:MAG: sigma-E processing peptidase SpoIIGA [Limnochordaceae bacterium]|nr:sigma-E processing peptidase SpoIIGA [Limnochordaceae bacterium]